MALLLLLAGCAATRGIAPLDRGQGAVHASLGGPFLNFGGAPIPVPVTEVGALYGLTDRTTGHAAIYPTNLAMLGVFGVDVGAYTELVPPAGARPRLVVDGTAYLFVGDNGKGPPGPGARFFPDVALIASWDLGRHHVFAGVDGFFQVHPVFRPYPTPLLGTQLRAGRVGLQAEVRWVAPWVRSDRWFVDWVHLGGHGVLGANLGMTVYLGRQD